MLLNFGIPERLHPCLAKLYRPVMPQVCARHGDQVLRDELVWDANNPCSSAHRYAASVCGDLGLDCGWFEALRAHVQAQLDDVVEVGHTHRACAWV